MNASVTIEERKREMEISEQEMRILNFYRVSELHGGLILGHMVGRAREPGLVLELTRHSADEVVHAQLWTETILAVGGRIQPIRVTYQRKLAALLGRRASLLQVLATTQVFERRVYRHFLDHVRRTGTHRRVQATLHRMLEEERHHLLWVKAWLDRQAAERPEEVEDALRRANEADEIVYRTLLREYGLARWSEGDVARDRGIALASVF